MQKNNVIRLPYLKWEDAPEYGYLGFRYMPFILEKPNQDNGFMEQSVAHDVYTEDDLHWSLANSGTVKPIITIGQTEKFKYRFLKVDEFEYIVDDLIRKKELPYGKGYHAEWEF